LTIVFGPKGSEVRGKCRKIHNKELDDLHSSPNIIQLIKSRRIKWAKHVARMGIGEVPTEFWWENRGERYHFKDLDLNGRITLRWIFRKLVGEHELH
jgi:hypothetical protein